MGNDILTDQDIKQLAMAGITADKAHAQIKFLKRGVKPLTLNRPCRKGDGIVVIPLAKLPKMAALHDEAARAGRFTKFVPASGAASRMFAHWHTALAKGASHDQAFEKSFADNLHKFAFFPDLTEAISRRGEDVEVLLRDGKWQDILHYILTSRGLNYGHLPKALLKFHAYKEGNRTALEEHLVEAAFFTTSAERICRIHFTVSEEHMKQISSFLAQNKKDYENRFGVILQIGLSAQSLASATLAMEGERLYRDGAGRLILRPGGHGSLLDNLNALEGDVVFIKNIDNVVPDRLKTEAIFFKKVLGGYYINIEKDMFRHLRKLSEKATDRDIEKAALFCQRKLNVVLPPRFEGFSLDQKRQWITGAMNRPLRVCGMVKNEGEPGGGPFWVDEGGSQSLQIVESHQIDHQSEKQRTIWSASTHFNPVDLVCGVRDYRSQIFDLKQFTAPGTVTLSKKTEKGRHITVLEHPGLWNGSMARWSTVFVEMPNTTFNPVKTIDDLLRPQHLGENPQAASLIDPGSHLL